MNINLSSIAGTSSSSAGGAGGVAQLQAKLKQLFTRMKDLAHDTSVDPKVKKMMQQSLQNQIQLVMKQIAELQAKASEGDSPETPTTTSTAQKNTKPSAPVRAEQGAIDTYA